MQRPCACPPNSIDQAAARSSLISMTMTMEEERRGGGGAAGLELELPGFRFHPTEEELLEFYLKQVARGEKLKLDIIPTVHLYRHDPWELPGLARIGEREWYFFVPRDHRKHAAAGSGGRPSRTTERGFWKATGSDRAVRCAVDPKRLIGLKKTLVYYEGRAPRGTKTDWVMNEYRLPDAAASSKEQDGMVLCKVYRKAVSLKELEQRVAMEELARATAAAAGTPTTPSAASHNTGSPADSMSSSDHLHLHPSVLQLGGETTPPAAAAPTAARTTTVMMMKQEAGVELPPEPLLARPGTLSLPQLEVAARPAQEWITQDPFLTQLRSPWMETWSPYFASVLNF